MEIPKVHVEIDQGEELRLGWSNWLWLGLRSFGHLDLRDSFGPGGYLWDYFYNMVLQMHVNTG